MKKTALLFLCVFMAMFCLSACGRETEASESDMTTTVHDGSSAILTEADSLSGASSSTTTESSFNSADPSITTASKRLSDEEQSSLKQEMNNLIDDLLGDE